MPTAPAATRELFAAMFDDAAIFPPGNAPLQRAVADHWAHRASAHAPLVGAFVCSDSRLPELAAALRLADRPLPLTLVVTSGARSLPRVLDDVSAEPRIDLRSVEIAVTEPEHLLGSELRDIAQATPPGLTCYVELPIDPGLGEALEQVAQVGVRAKFRTGGATSAAFPTELELAAAISSTLAHRVAFKLTAGLHHAVRHRDPVTGFQHHGFLNVVAAVAAGLDNAPEADVAALLGERSAEPLVAVAVSADATAVRASFASFGTCSVDDPVRDLTRLGLLAAPS